MQSSTATTQQDLLFTLFASKNVSVIFFVCFQCLRGQRGQGPRYSSVAIFANRFIVEKVFGFHHAWISFSQLRPEENWSEVYVQRMWSPFEGSDANRLWTFLLQQLSCYIISVSSVVYSDFLSPLLNFYVNNV